MRRLFSSNFGLSEVDLAMMTKEAVMVVNDKQLPWIQKRREIRKVVVTERKKMVGRSLHAKRRYINEVSGFTRRKVPS